MKCTIAGIIKNKQGEFLSENSWSNDIDHAILFTPQQIEAAILVLSEKSTSLSVEAAYVIQNEKFDYYGGKSGWVYRINEAIFYSAFHAAETQVKALSC